MTILQKLPATLTCVLLAFSCASALFGQERAAKQPITIQDLVTYTRIRKQRVSPDGKWVTYLTIKPNFRDNRYDSTLFLQRTEPSARPVELARFHTTADKTFLETGGMKNFGGQVTWSRDGKWLAFTKREADKIQVWLRSIEAKSAVKIAGDFSQVDFDGWEETDAAISFKVADQVSGPRASSETDDPGQERHTRADHSALQVRARHTRVDGGQATACKRVG
jgi:Tol biopolymer transport system component